jgi:hypothetical protein
VTPKFISRSDPAAQWTVAHKGHAFFVRDQPVEADRIDDRARKNMRAND